MRSLLLNRCLILLIVCQCFSLANSASWADNVSNTNSQSNSEENKKITGGVNTTHSARYHYPRPSFKITGMFSRILQKCTGVTYISEVTTDYVAERILKKKFGGKVKVTVKTYSFTDLLHLKVRIATVRMVGSHYKNIPLGKVEIESRTPFWLGLGPHKRPSLQQSALLSFKMQVSDKELDQILHSERVTSALRLLKLDLSSIGPGLDEQKLQMHEPELTLDNDLIVLKAIVATSNADPSTGSPLTVSGEPKLHGDDRIFLEQVKVESPDITEPEKFSKFVENLINPLINLKRFDRCNFAVRLDDLKVKPEQLSVAGRIILGPDQPIAKPISPLSGTNSQSTIKPVKPLPGANAIKPLNPSLEIDSQSAIPSPSPKIDSPPVIPKPPSDLESQPLIKPLNSSPEVNN